MHPQYTTNDVSRFWAKVDQSGDCWLWTASKYLNGYGQFSVNRRPVPAHRVAYELNYGLIPPNMCVCHTCDTPACVNPTHLFLGTQKDNLRDMVKKGRMVTKERHWTNTHPEKRAYGNRNGSRKHPEQRPRGETNGRATMTADDIRTIRARAARGENQRSIAADYGVRQGSISRIILRLRWRHID